MNRRFGVPALAGSGPPEGGTPNGRPTPRQVPGPNARRKGVEALSHEPTRSGTGVPPVRTRRPTHGRDAWRDARATGLGVEAVRAAGKEMDPNSRTLPARQFSIVLDKRTLRLAEWLSIAVSETEPNELRHNRTVQVAPWRVNSLPN
jgi:hypothetical protein